MLKKTLKDQIEYRCLKSWQKSLIDKDFNTDILTKFLLLDFNKIN